MNTAPSTRRDISADDFADDSHAAKYRGELNRHPAAYLQLFALLNDPANEQRLLDAEMHNLPALCGIVRFIEADPELADVLAQGRSSLRSRQTVGVAVKLKMAKLGWRATGKKGAVAGAEHFTKAERYVANAAVHTDPATRALAALEAVAAMGDEAEREATGRELTEALAATRHALGRPF